MTRSCPRQLCGVHGSPELARLRWLAVWLVWLAGFAVSVPAQAAPTRASTAQCPPGNLLANAAIVTGGRDSGAVAMLTDGVVAPEGESWPPPSVMYASGRRTLVFDLGRAVPARALLVQADADAALTFGLSQTGSVWQRHSMPSLPSAGLRSRYFNLPETAARYFSVTSAHPTAGISATEIALYCQPPTQPGQGLRVAEHADSSISPGWLAPLWMKITGTPLPSHQHVAFLRLVLALGALLLIGAAWLAGRPPPWPEPGTEASRGSTLTRAAAVLARPGQRRARDGLLVTLALLSVFAYHNFGGYHLPGFAQKHDTFHYFIGSKYFAELGYSRLYRCAALAEAEAGFEPRVRLRHQRNLENNELVTGAAALEQARECTHRFSPARWESFSADVGEFANAYSVPQWHSILRDHGFNASPLWIAVGGSIVQPLPAAPSIVGHGDSMFGGLLPLLDLVLLGLALGAVWWAFGWRLACFAVIVFGCNPLAEFLWVGGAFLRQLWFWALLSGICLLRRKWFLTGGALLATSALLRLFPAFCLVPVAMLVALRWWHIRQVPRAGSRVLLGAALATIVLLPWSVWMVGVDDAWAQFLGNTLKHAATPSANLVGLPTALSFRFSTRADLLFDATQTDAFAAVRAARVETLRAMRPIHFAAVAVALWWVYRALRQRTECWMAGVLGLALVPIALQLSCYYYSLLVVLALLGHERRVVLVLVLLCLAATTTVELFTDPIDVRYAIWSWIVVVTIGAVLAQAGRLGVSLALQRRA